MNTDIRLPPKFEGIRDEDETILWMGKPNFTVFLLSGIPFLLFGLLWGGFDLFFLTNILSSKTPAGTAYFAVPFMLLHSAPFWLSIANVVRLFLVHGNTLYAISNKRLILRSGFWGTDFRTIDYDRVADLEVNVGPIENMLGVGTIRAFSGATTSKGGRLYDSFVGIERPYEVFKKIKQVSVDIKTDWNYPNALRPGENPGYRTKYTRKP